MSNDIKLHAGQYRHVSQISRILKWPMIIDKYIWVVLPDNVLPYSMIHVRELKTHQEVSDISYEGRFIRIPCNKLNNLIGLHQYEIKFKNMITSDESYLYFQYIIQKDDPETSYIYMKREDEEDNATSDIFE